MKIDTFMKSIKVNQSKLSKESQQQIRKHVFSHIDFDDFMQRVERFEMNESAQNKNKIAFSAYLNNYYLWMLCCDGKYCSIRKEFEEKGKIRSCYESAIAKIKSFDIILPSEWMNDLRARLFVNQFLFNKFVELKSFDDRLFVDVVAVPYKHFVTDKGRNYMISKQSLSKLKEWNKWDMKIYQFVKRLTFERMKKVWSQNGGQLLYNETFVDQHFAV